MEYIFSIAARSLIRHAVVGALTGGTGNALILAGDMMNISDTVDAIDAIDEIDVVDAGSSYGSGSHHDVLVTANGNSLRDTNPDGDPVAQSGTRSPNDSPKTYRGNGVNLPTARTTTPTTSHCSQISAAESEGAGDRPGGSGFAPWSGAAAESPSSSTRNTSSNSPRLECGEPSQGLRALEAFTTPDRYLVGVSLGCSVLAAYLENERQHSDWFHYGAVGCYILWACDMSVIAVRYPGKLALVAKGIIGTALGIACILNWHFCMQLKDIAIFAPIIVNVSIVLQFSSGPPFTPPPSSLPLWDNV